MIKKIISSIPNTITCCNLLSGCLACIATFHMGETLIWGMTGLQLAWLLIAAATVFDFCDGLSARLLKAHSKLGKELDSLADLVSFGLAPGMMMYNILIMFEAPAWTPWIAMSIPVLGALRLARFNVDERQTTSFIGLPIPSNAIFWIGYTAWLAGINTPMTSGIMQGWILWLTVGLMPAVALMMVCGLPMFSLKFKSMNPRINALRYVIIIAAIILVATIGIPGLALAIVLYILLSVIDNARH
ncbi:MAG: CDP-diacylglycerol--serine O-phosphatidyltransferase [Clostridiales bacterium]|nr:CDP-diacylglycerol--serine O-phosphatidyltransferase [Clostridiales bacterium]